MRSLLVLAMIVACAAAFGFSAMDRFTLMRSDVMPKCGGKCPFGNNNCTNPDCSRCNGPKGFNGICVKGHECAANCSADGDCNQRSTCNLCIGGVCSAGCGKQCTNASHCGGPCNACVSNVCVEWSCGKKCTGNSECPGPCGTCSNGTCISQCNSTCVSAKDCDQSACPHCIEGKCQSAGKCKARCNSNLQCDATADCNLCIEGHCAAGCGANCTDHTTCGEPGCGSCIAGKCQPWTCGKSCNRTKGCEGNCATCTNGTCFTQCGGMCLTASDCPHSCSECDKGMCKAKRD